MTEQQIRNDSERTDGGTEPVHEGFHQDDPSRFAGEWFSWSNAMFAEFVLSVCGLEIQAGGRFRTNSKALQNTGSAVLFS